MQQEPQWRDHFLLPAPELCGWRFFDTLFGGACCMVMLSYGMLVDWGVVLNRSESDLSGPSRALFFLVLLSVPWSAMFLVNGGPALLRYEFWLAVLALVVLLPLVRRRLIQKMFRFGQCEALESLGRHLVLDRAQAERPSP